MTWRNKGIIYLVCNVCQKEFYNNSSKTRHLRTIHKESMEKRIKKSHIICPLCSEKDTEPFGFHDGLIDHLKQIHLIHIKESSILFRNMDEFEAWRKLDHRDVDYIYERGVMGSNNEKYSYYHCNRGDTRGFISQGSKRNMKKGGSIKISGLCPSRIRVKTCDTGAVVSFIETHVGHEEDLRSRRLSKNQQEDIATKLMAGVTTERILTDAKTIVKNKIERTNLLTRGDLAYIIKKYNIVFLRLRVWLEIYRAIQR